MAKESKDPFKKITTQEDVLACFTIDPHGIAFRSTLDDPNISHKYAALTYALVRKLKRFLALRKPEHELLQFTIRLTDMEILLHSAKDFTMVTFRKLTSTAEDDDDIDPDIFADSSVDDLGQKKWFDLKSMKKVIPEEVLEVEEEEVVVEEEETGEENDEGLQHSSSFLFGFLN